MLSGLPGRPPAVRLGWRNPMTPTDSFLKARDFLLKHREDYETAYRDFVWPTVEHFNWARDWFDVHARGNTRTALRIIHDSGPDTAVSFAELSERSNRVANFLLTK